MPTFRVTILIASGKKGWSETWFRNATNLDAMAVPTSKLLAYRLRFMGNHHTFEGVRIGVVGMSRNGAPYLPPGGPIRPGGPTLLVPRFGGMSEIAPIGGGTALGPGTIPWSQANDALQVYVMNQGRRLGTRYFAPIPLNIIGGDLLGIRRDLVPEFWEGWSQFYTYITGADPNLPGSTPTPSEWAVRSVINTDPTKEKEIISWRLSAGADTDLTLEVAAGDALPGVTTKSKVVVRKARMKFKGMKSPNGTWRVASVVAPAGGVGQLITIRRSSTISVDNIDPYGLVRVQEISYPVVDDLRVARIGTHKRGVPFGVTAGRLSTPNFAPL